MKPDEARRVNVVEQLVQGAITVSQAAGLLCLSTRQVKRIKKGVKEQGITFLAHKNRGRKPKHAISAEIRQEVARLALGEYKDASCTHIAELMALYQQTNISSRSVQRILQQTGIANIHSQKVPRRRRSRERIPREGMLAQIDASPYHWLEERGAKMNLHGAIDDATSKTLGLRFEPEECLSGYMHVLMQMAENGAMPQQIYSDRHSIFFSPNKDKLTIEEELAGKKEALTQFGRILEELGATQIPAYSPQAKGRIERLWGTLQHRLVVEMRIAGITTIQEANAFLPAFIKRFNNRFAVQPADLAPAYLTTPIEPNNIICTKNERKASNGSVISFQGQTYRLVNKDGCVALLRPRSTVQVLTHLDGSLSALYEGNWLSLEVFSPALPSIPKKPKSNPVHKPTIPSTEHPWRKQKIGKNQKTDTERYVIERHIKRAESRK